LEENVFSISNQDKLKQYYDDQIIQLKSNKLPKGLVTLESIFSRDDELRRNKAGMQVKEDHYEDLEVADGKFLKLGKVCTQQEKSEFIELYKEFPDIFAWEYSDLKGFDPNLAQHTIELLPNAKPIK
jgi:hypothetical protein